MSLGSLTADAAGYQPAIPVGPVLTAVCIVD